MKRLLFFVLVGLFSFSVINAQEVKRSYVGPTQNPKAKKSLTTATNTAPKPKQTSSPQTSKSEIYVGYVGSVASKNSTAIPNSRQVQNGVQTSVNFNVSRYFGLKGDFSLVYRDRNQPITQNGVASNLNRRTTVTNILGGLQMRDNDSDAGLRPFAHILVGAANFRQKFTDRNCDNNTSGVCGSLIRSWGLAGAVGGGFDVKVANRAGIRFSSDYNPMRIKNETINNFRFGVGIVFK